MSNLRIFAWMFTVVGMLSVAVVICSWFSEQGSSGGVGDGEPGEQNTVKWNDATRWKHQKPTIVESIPYDLLLPLGVCLLLATRKETRKLPPASRACAAKQPDNEPRSGVEEL